MQSNVSAMSARLERELGVMLVDRHTGRLTEEGTAVVDGLAGSSRARRHRRRFAPLDNDVSGDARFGVIGTTARWLVARPPRRAPRATSPPSTPSWSRQSTTSLALQLLSGHLDLAVVNLPADDIETCTTEALFEEDLVLVTPADHPLARNAIG